MNKTTTQHHPRTDEATFRACVPRTIGCLTVLEVIGYQRGAEGVSYACAFAIAEGTDWPGRWSTHRVICQDDCRNAWILESGHYDFPTRWAAWQDLLNRADRGQ